MNGAWRRCEAESDELGLGEQLRTVSQSVSQLVVSRLAQL